MHIKVLGDVLVLYGVFALLAIVLAIGTAPAAPGKEYDITLIESTAQYQVTTDTSRLVWPWQTYQTAAHNPPVLNITRLDGETAPGYIFTSPVDSNKQDGTYDLSGTGFIMDQRGDLIFAADEDGMSSCDGWVAGTTDFRAQGKYITYWTDEHDEVSSNDDLTLAPDTWELSSYPSGSILASRYIRVIGGIYLSPRHGDLPILGEDGDIISDSIPSLYGKRVVAYGCRHGEFSGYARANGAASVLGIDEPTMIRDAKEETADKAIEFLAEDLQSAPLPADLFDAVYSAGVMHYIEYLPMVFTEIRTSLNPGVI